MATHSAVLTVGVKKPLEVHQVPTVTPIGDEVRVRVQWTASTPLDLHQNDGGLLVSPPQVLGDGLSGTVVEVGPDVKMLKVEDQVFGFTWRSQAEKAHQEFCTSNEWLFAKLPAGFTLAETVTLPNNFVTVFHSLTADLDIDLPWPKSADYEPSKAGVPILIWGGSSSVGQYAIQVLRYYGFCNIMVTASKKHHSKLRALGAGTLFDYNDVDVSSTISEAMQIPGGNVAAPIILDCIGSQAGSIAPISRIATSGAKVAVLMPVIIKDANESDGPEYGLDAAKAADWAEGVSPRSVFTHSYLNNQFFREHLQSDVMPTMLKDKIVAPNAVSIIEGDTLLERAQNAMDALRRKEASMQRLVWRVSDA